MTLAAEPADAAGGHAEHTAEGLRFGRHWRYWPTLLWVAAVLSAAAGTLLRFAAVSPLWLDEALSVNIASLPPPDVIDALRHDGHPMLYYLALGLWMDVLSDSDFAARALSGLFSLAAAAVIWAAARRRFDADAARFAGVLALTSPFLIRYGNEARMYALVVLLAATGWLLTELVIEQRAWWRPAALAVTVAAGLHTHYWMIWLAGAASILAIAAWLHQREQRRDLAPLLVAYGCGWLAFTPWLGVLAEQAAHTGTPWAKWARPAEVVVESVEGIGGGTRFEPLLLGMIIAAAAALGATLLGGGERSVELAWPGRNPAWPVAAVAVLTLALGGSAALASGSAFEARYVAVAVPFVLALAGRGLAGLPAWSGLAVVAIVAAFGIAVAVDEIRRDRSQGEEVAEAINLGANLDDGADVADDANHSDAVGAADTANTSGAADGVDIVIACPDQLAPAVLRYLEVPLQVLTFPPTDDPGFVDWYDYRSRIDAASAVAVARSALAKAGPQGAIWLVSASGYHGFGERCDELAATLSADGRGPHRVVSQRPVYEPMLLRRFSPATR